MYSHMTRSESSWIFTHSWVTLLAVNELRKCPHMVQILNVRDFTQSFIQTRYWVFSKTMYEYDIKHIVEMTVRQTIMLCMGNQRRKNEWMNERTNQTKRTNGRANERLTQCGNKRLNEHVDEWVNEYGVNNTCKIKETTSFDRHDETRSKKLHHLIATMKRDQRNYIIWSPRWNEIKETTSFDRHDETRSKKLHHLIATMKRHKNNNRDKSYLTSTATGIRSCRATLSSK